MVVFKWKNGSCSDGTLQMMQLVAKKIEDRVLSLEDRSSAHLPTLLNDELYVHSSAVAVSHNTGQGSSFRGMECSQFEIAGQVYNLAVIRK